MIIVDQIYHPKVSYAARNFDEQEGQRFTIMVGADKPIETAVYLHWLGGKQVDIAVDISCMSGCTRKCIFCAAAHSSPTLLDPDEILDQVALALARVRPSHHEFFDHTLKHGKITFSFQGIGEPADASAEVSEAISRLRERYSSWKRVEFSIASILDRPEVLKQWAHLNLKTLQFSLHAPTDSIRKELLGGQAKRRIGDILAALDEFHIQSPDTEIKLNYVLIEGKNDSDQDSQDVLELLNDRPDYFLKISYLNETLPSRIGHLRPSRRHDSFLARCSEQHARTYGYGAFRQLQISCGQLASYAQPERRTSQLHDDIAALYEDIKDSRVTLFLGAGASYTSWNARELAKNLYGELTRATPYSEAGLSLSEVADAFEQRRARHKVDSLISMTLRNAKVPEAMYYLPRHYWRAIYTTNYDEFIERAYNETRPNPRTQRHPHQVLQPSDLQGMPVNAIPIIKLHGSVSQGVRKTISDTDYLDGYVESIELLLNKLAVDRLEGSLLFVGYSFRDQFIKQWLYNLKRNLPRTQGKLWAVLPPNESTSDERERLKEQLGVTLIATDFLSLMQELEVLRRRPVLMAVGSKRSAVRGSPETARTGATQSMDEFCRLIADGLQARSVHLISGATATDKVGYLVARHMEPAHVTTYTWHGYEDDPDNHPELMISKRMVGNRPSAVVAHMLKEAGFVLLIGGGSMALREAMAAIAQGIPVIPIAIGGQFASDIVHDLFSSQYKAVRALSADTGLDAEHGIRIINVLTPTRLQRLRLDKFTVSEVASTVLDVLDHTISLGSEAILLPN